MKVAYKAYDGSGKTATGLIEAGDMTAAADMLRHKGLFVAELTEQVVRAGRNTRRRRKWIRGGQKLKNLTMFSRQLYVLISSGTQLVDALGAMERQVPPGAWREVIGGLRTRVEEGASLSEAMEAQPRYFDPVYRSLIAAGESSGCLVDMFDRLAALKQKQLRVHNSVAGAMVYPCMLLTLGLTIFTGLLLFVVPRFGGLFTTLEVPLPASTQVLLGISTAVRGYWWLMAALVVGAVCGVVYGLRTPRAAVCATGRFCASRI